MSTRTLSALAYAEVAGCERAGSCDRHYDGVWPFNVGEAVQMLGEAISTGLNPRDGKRLR